MKITKEQKKLLEGAEKNDFNFDNTKSDKFHTTKDVKELKAKILELLNLSNNDDNDFDWDTLTIKMKQQDTLMDDIKKLAKQNNTLLGRIIRFPMADSYAVYIITRVYKTIVHVEWVNYCDGWIDDRLGKEGVLPILYATNYINGQDKLAELFSKK